MSGRSLAGGSARRSRGVGLGLALVSFALVAACNALNGSGDLAFGPGECDGGDCENLPADGGKTDGARRDGGTGSDSAPGDVDGQSCPACGGKPCCAPSICRSDGTCGACSNTAPCGASSDCCGETKCGQTKRCVTSCGAADAGCTNPGATTCCVGLACILDPFAPSPGLRCTPCKTNGASCFDNNECCSGKCPGDKCQ